MSDEHSIEEIAAEFLERRQAGEDLKTEDFLAEHPEHADELRELLILMLDMEKINSDKTQIYSPPQPERTNLPDSDYRLVRKIGSGGMGIVFEAVQVSLNRRVAVKLLNSSLLTNDEQRAQFENEAKVIAMLHHPNIVKIYSAGCSKERCYYAMELIEGKGLDSCQFDDLRELAQIGLQAAQALAYAHRCGILHRDIKPANMLLDTEGNIHISDFGIAFILSGNEPIIESRGSRSGTLRYMAPERLVEGINSFATDQYAFGVTLYEVVTGKPILQSKSQEDMLKRVCTGEIEQLSCDEPEFAAIINKCISFDPHDRYADMDEVVSDLQHFLNREPVKAYRSTLLHRFVLWCRRKPVVAALTFVSAGCAAALVISLIVGFIQTRAALKLAEQNAQAADSAISQIFKRISEQPPSRKNAELLNALLPYYRMIAGQRNIPPSKICEAYAVIGECAMRTGSYDVAEAAYRNMMKYRTDAYPVNRLAEVLSKRGKTEDANRLYHQVVEKYEKSKKAEDRFETVRALLALSRTQDSEERSRAFRILETLLTDQPDNPEYRFLYAVLLGGNPRLYHSLRIPGVEPNAAKLLTELAEEHPEQPEYGLALVELMFRRFRLIRGIRNSRDEVEEAVKLSEHMLGRWPNDPQIVSAVVKLHSRYIEFLRRNGEDKKIRKEYERLLGILEILFYNPEISDPVKEELIQIQLRRLQMFRKRGASEEIEALSSVIFRELDYYHGPKREDYRKQLDQRE